MSLLTHAMSLTSQKCGFMFLLSDAQNIVGHASVNMGGAKKDLMKQIKDCKTAHQASSIWKALLQ